MYNAIFAIWRLENKNICKCIVLRFECVRR
nr:MAG TPA: hypothetical protein [Caudoviricetes sp.]